MGFLDNSTTTVDAILTTRGRELLSSGEGLNITKFALSDEEVDYTLFDVTHPNGTDSYGSVIENMNLLEAIPNRRTFNSFLVDVPLTGAGIVVSNLTNSNVAGGAVVPLSPTSDGDEQFVFTISNTNVVRFQGDALSRSVRRPNVTLLAQKITESATATVSILGVNTGLTSIVSVQVNKTEGASINPDSPEKDNLDPATGVGTGYGG
jgi:hypothetical protein|tara:strand:- start:453 stop:1073 length:621 start_codon:yes stop_codon:yes gene_type:complete